MLLRLGTVPYLNAVPLTRGLEDEVKFVPPARLAEMLRNNELDAALVSIVEVLFTDLQRSPTYPAGLALRFARVARIRDDKTPADADTVQHLHALFARQQARAAGREGEA